MSSIQGLKLLKPKKIKKLNKTDVSTYTRLKSKEYMLNTLKGFRPGPLALDIETTGVQAADLQQEIVGIGLSDGHSTKYYHLHSLGSGAISGLYEWLASPDIHLIAHNLYFDKAFLEHRVPESVDWNWTACTYGLFRQLSTEGYPDQRWGLKSAQLNLLGWDSTNETELLEWLANKGYYKAISIQPREGWPRIIYKGEVRYANPNKSEMSKAPADILGYYCGLDAYSTYQLYVKILLPAINRLPSEKARDLLWEYHSQVFLTNVNLNIRQQLTGINIDLERLKTYQKGLVQEISQAEQLFLSHPRVKYIVNGYNRQVLIDLENKKPDKYKKDGDISKNYTNWLDRYTKAQGINHFNINSGPQLRYLFYDRLGYPVKLRTESGLPAVDKKALLGFGEEGKLLKKQTDKFKELGYVNSCLEHTVSSCRGDRIYPSVRIPGTLTGRLAGSGGLNIQQQPNIKGYLECWRPEPGRVWVYCDHDALENIVLTELSKDKSLYKLYGPGQPANDGHLFTGASLPILGEKIKAAGYDPDNPTPEGIRRAKKLADKERSIAKTINYASVYKAGTNRLKQTLDLEGISLEWEVVDDMRKAYWKLYSGVKDYDNYLVDQLRLRDGWVYNGIGRPLTIADTAVKDVVNRVIQSTGHDIHMVFIYYLNQIWTEMGLTDLVEPVIIDLHDATIVSITEDKAEQVKQSFNTAYQRLNNWLDGEIPITGEPEIIRCFAETKFKD